MSGIATYTRTVADLLKGTKTKLLDTRKTTPGMRIFEKYAVKVGGGYNHRYNLSDGILLKDNHIGAAGYEILSTHNGYFIHKTPLAERVFKLYHTTEQTEDELNTIEVAVKNKLGFAEISN